MLLSMSITLAIMVNIPTFHSSNYIRLACRYHGGAGLIIHWHKYWIDIHSIYQNRNAHYNLHLYLELYPENSH